MPKFHLKGSWHLISKAEVQRLAFTTRLGIETVQKDWALGWMLFGLSSTEGWIESLVFKGGTAIKKCYDPEYRFSDDLDWTARESLSLDRLVSLVRAAIDKASSTGGIQLRLDARDVEITPNGTMQIKVQFLGPLGALGSVRTLPKIKLDVTSAKQEAIVRPILNRRILHGRSPPR
jgi:hypothetical protein